ncbi:MAG: GNAT family N-acetyltransferase [Lachnospiraceae bacterium]|nr:GNAT family N-acetyltransferase [Lachnospiraceae bacterium]
MDISYKTQRLLLRTLDVTYYQQILHFLKSNCVLFERFERDKPSDYYTPEYQHQAVEYEYQLIKKKQHLRLFVFLHSNPDKIIGTVSFSNFKHFPTRTCEIGYKFDPDFHHQGYALEAVEKALDIIFSEYNMRRVNAYIQPSNTPSLNLVSNLGFTRKELIQNYAEIQGISRDHYLYVLDSPYR